MKLRITVMALIVLSAVALTACGGDDDSSTSDPSGTTGSTVTAAPTAPPVAEPELDEGVTEIARDDLGEVDVPVGGVYYIDPTTLAGDATTPPCENFQFAFAWQVTDPYPPAEDALEWQIQSEGGNETLSGDPDGSESVGCEPLQAVNNGEDPVTVAVKYAVGARP